MGPWLIPFTHAAQLDDIRLTTHVNGELRQDDRTSRMLFPIRRQIEYISTFTTLHPGDIIVTGTPTGAGARFEPAPAFSNRAMKSRSAPKVSAPSSTAWRTRHDPARDRTGRAISPRSRGNRPADRPALHRSPHDHHGRRLCRPVRADRPQEIHRAPRDRLEDRPHLPRHATGTGHHHPPTAGVLLDDMAFANGAHHPRGAASSSPASRPRSPSS